MIRIILDQGIPCSTAELLRSTGWDAIHVSECGLSAATDEAIIEYARTDNRVVCTLDSDFHALLAVSGALRPSVIRIRQEGLHAPDVVLLLKRVWDVAKAAIDSGAVVTITQRAIRVRRLPIHGK